MDRRLILGLVIAVLAGGLLIAVLGGVFRGGAASASPSGAAGATLPAATPGASADPGASATLATGPLPTCPTVLPLVAVRATDASTGFPVPVEWLGLGPADETFFTQSEVAPTLPIDPTGPGAIIVALQYISSSGDRYKLTGGSLTLAFDPATGRLTGSLDTGYGKNSNRATTDTVPSQLDATYARPTSAGASGVLEGTISHPDRESYLFRVQMVEVQSPIGLPAGCASAPPVDASFTP